MSREELEKLIEKNLAAQTVSTETGLRVAQKIKEIADRENIEFAIAGGLAMHLYGFERATKDVDFVAERGLPLKIVRYLSFGGERYKVEIGDEKIDVDWIMRRDNYKNFYKQALADATELKSWKILTPEWLVILKYIAGSAKDRLDLLWLLQQKTLVKRKKVKENIVKVIGELGAAGFLLGLQREYDLADVMGLRASGDENESYVPDDEEYPDYNN